MNKQVRNRIIKKKIHVRIEHVKKSNCRKQFLERLVSNQAEAKMAQNEGSTLPRLRATHNRPRCTHTPALARASSPFIIAAHSFFDRVFTCITPSETVVLKRVPTQPRAGIL